MLFLWKRKIWKTLLFSTNINFCCLLPLRRGTSLQLKKTFSVMPFCTINAQKHGPGFSSYRGDACLQGVKPALLLPRMFPFPYSSQRALCLREITSTHCDKTACCFASPSKSLEHAVGVNDPLKHCCTFLVLHSEVNVVCILDLY